MTQGEKELLLTDLCARTLYGVICLNKVTKEVYKLCYVTSYNEISLDDRTAVFYSPDDIIPYLRPMSSMTEKELDELRNYTGLLYDNLDLASFQNGSYKCLDFYLSEIPADVVIKVFDWLHMHHFDYRGLINMGLALEALEGMYK